MTLRALVKQNVLLQADESAQALAASRKGKLVVQKKLGLCPKSIQKYFLNFHGKI